MKDAFETTMSAAQSWTEAAVGRGLEEAFCPTLTLIFGEKLELSALLGDGPTGSDYLSMIEAFAYRRSRRRRLPDFAFFAAESVADGGERIMLSGCSTDLIILVCYLQFERDQSGKIIPSSWTQAGPVNECDRVRVPAYRAMKGAMARANAPWWKL